MKRDKIAQQKSDSQRKLSAGITYLWLSVWNYKYGMNLWLSVSHIAVRRRICSCVCGWVEMSFTAPHIRSDFVFSVRTKALCNTRATLSDNLRQREYIYKKIRLKLILFYKFLFQQQHKFSTCHPYHVCTQCIINSSKTNISAFLVRMVRNNTWDII